MMMQRRFAGLLRLLVLAVMASGASVHAQDADRDPPGRVARLSELNGPVWLYSPDSGEWTAATLNLPMTSGDRVATEAGARAALQIGSTTVRVDAGSELEIAQLDDDHVALRLHDGSAIVRVRDPGGAGQLELDTDEGRFVTLRAGTYRFDRNDGQSAVTVYSGQARYEGPNSGLAVDAGQRAEFWIDSGGVAQYSLLSPVNDAFAAWSNDRDRRVAGSIAERYVSPEMTGAAELDAYGRWEQTPDYGSVWIPTAVAPGWAPYSQGRWTWVRPWGWTWVDDAPWGFAPFHYGRWVHLRNNWCWTPGSRVARPVYAPALVAWIGGPRVSVSVTVGGGPAVGWFPLAPREVYVPSYPVSPRYARNVNITNVTNVTVINNVFANPQGPREFENRRFPRAITVVPANVMAERQPVAPAAAQYRQTPWVREFANDRGRTTAMLAPPVATPPMPARPADPRGVRPPPGARPEAGDRPGFSGRPGVSPRDRDRSEAERDRGRQPPSPLPSAPSQGREPERAGFGPGQRAPGWSPPQQQPSPGLAQPSRPPVATSPVTSLPPAVNRPPAAFEPGQRRPDAGAPGRMPPDRDAVEAAPRMPFGQPQQPVRPVAAPPAPQEAPMMRALPVRRGDDRPDDRRTEDRRPPPRPQMQQMPQQPPRIERSAPPQAQQPAARPVDSVRPAAPAALPPPMPRAQPPQPAPARAQRPETRGDEPKRGEPREPR